MKIAKVERISLTHTHTTIRYGFHTNNRTPILGETVPRRKSPAAVDVKKSTKTPTARGRQLGVRSGPIGSLSMRAAVYCPAGNQPDSISAHGAWLHLFLLAPNAFCGIRAILCSYQGLKMASWLDGGRWGARRNVRWLADSTLVACFFVICGHN